MPMADMLSQSQSPYLLSVDAALKILLEARFQVTTISDRSCQRKGNFYVARVLRPHQDDLTRVQSTKLNI